MLDSARCVLVTRLYFKTIITMSKETQKEIEKDLKTLSLFHLTYALHDATTTFLKNYTLNNKNSLRYLRQLKEKTGLFATMFDRNTNREKQTEAQLNMVSKIDMLIETVDYLSLVDKEKENEFLKGVHELALKYAKRPKQ